MKNQEINRRNFLASASMGIAGVGISNGIINIKQDKQPIRI